MMPSIPTKRMVILARAKKERDVLITKWKKLKLPTSEIVKLLEGGVTNMTKQEQKTYLINIL